MLTSYRLVARRIGARVPRGDVVGAVHSVFANAVNVDIDGNLVGIAASPLAAGPMTVVLAGPVPRDLRELFGCGERVRVRGDALCTERAMVSLQQATPIEPLAPRALLAASALRLRTAQVKTSVALLRRSRSSVVDGAAADGLARFVAAMLDPRAGLPHADLDRLIGWGEGLTPACDDFIVGLLAGWSTLDMDCARLDALRLAVRARLSRTTVFSAQALRLATEGAFNEPLDRARDALFCESDWARVQTELGVAAWVGATSGVDALSGLVAALDAFSSIVACDIRQAA